MNAIVATQHVRVAVLGNPNTGKSTLFNALTASRQHTGNYPGVTIERREGYLTVGQTRLELVDLPGTYSLAPRSPDELIAVQVLLGQVPDQRLPDLILCVVDASNLERNLFLVSQLLDLNLPLVVALNMTDVAARRGWEVDVERLEHLLGVPVVPIQAHRRIGIDTLCRRMVEVIHQPPRIPHDPFSQQVSERIATLDRACPDDCPLKRFVVTRMLFDADGLMTGRLKSLVGPEVVERLQSEQSDLAAATGVSLAEQESQGRYGWIKANSHVFLRRNLGNPQSWSSRLDDWLTHPVYGLVVASAVLFALFQIVFQAATPASQLIDWIQAALAGLVESWMPAGAFQSLLVDGLIMGVGSVLVFLPQIMLLFLIIGWLEDSGYLARASYLADRYLSRIGLSGVSVIPLLSSYACAIPGIMAARVIDDRRDRMVTILVAPLMSCSARLPVYLLLIAAFVPQSNLLWGTISVQGLCLLAMYLLGTLVAVVAAWILRRAVFRGGSSSFVFEMPSYKWPQWSVVWRRVWEGGKSFVQSAGTTIVAVTILVWAAAYFPRAEASLPIELREQRAALQSQWDQIGSDDSLGRQRVQEALAANANRIDAAHLENSFLGRAGRYIEPVVAPLGWDWRIGSAALASFPAREVVVSTLGILFGLGEDVDEESDTLREALKQARHELSGAPLFNLPVALGLMVFFALCAQCASTMAVIGKETRTWRWPVVTFLYMSILAYLGAWLTYRISLWFWG